MILNIIKRKFKTLLIRHLKPLVDEINLTTYQLYGFKHRLEIHPTAKVTNSLFNTFSGNIKIDPYVFMGHNVSLLTGSHDYTLKSESRMLSIPQDGFDIHIKKGAWIGSNSTILGPCTIGKHSVIAAGSVITKDVEQNTIVGGCPGRLIKKINFD